MTQMSGKDTTVSVTLPEPVYNALEVGSTNRGMTLPEYIQALLVTNMAVSTLDAVGATVTNKKASPRMKDPIVFLQKNLENSNPFTARFSDTTTLAIPVGVRLNIYDLVLDTKQPGFDVCDVLDAKHCRITTLVNWADTSYDLQYHKFQVVPVRDVDLSTTAWTVYAPSIHFPEKRNIRCVVTLDTLSGEVYVQSEDPSTSGVMMQFRFK